MKYKQFASRHNANLPKLDPLVSKRLHNERRDEEHPDLTGSYSKATLMKIQSKAKLNYGRNMRKSGSVPSITGGLYPYNHDGRSAGGQPEIIGAEVVQDGLNSQILSSD